MYKSNEMHLESIFLFYYYLSSRIFRVWNINMQNQEQEKTCMKTQGVSS